MRRGIVTWVAILGLAMFAASCSDDTDPKKDKGVPDQAIADQAITPDSAPKEAGPDTGPKEGGTPDAAQTKITFMAKVQGFGISPTTYMSGATVTLYDNATGTAVSGTATQTSDSNGRVTFANLIQNKEYGFKATLTSHKDTFVWNWKAVAPSGTCTSDTDCGAGKACDTTQSKCVERIWIISNTVYNLCLAQSGLTHTTGKSDVAGAVYWVDSAGKEEGIGCAKVSSNPTSTDIRYMSPTNGLPTTLTNQPCTDNKSGKGNGRYLAANLSAGTVTVTAKDHTTATIGSTKLWSIADSVAISNIYAASTVTSNPTPTTCTCTP